mgnify:CR=1 FL=1
MARIHTILQCFVDLNLETDENSSYSLNLPKISFEQPIYSIIEGQTIGVVVTLDSPSENGLEEVELGVVINNTSVSDFSNLGQTYPQTLIISAGEQTKTLSFLANTDLFEEGVESFDLILGFFTNTTPGQYITTTVNIIDETNLRQVSIDEQGGFVIPGTSDADSFTSTPPSLGFSAIEGASRNIIIALDSPSVLGVESVDVEFTNISANSSDYVVAGSTTLSWAIGEQNKIITVQANDEGVIEDDETLNIKLVNPVNVDIVSFSQANFTIIDTAPAARFVTANFQGFYIQKGKSTPNVEARYITRNTTVSTQDETWRMFIRFGDYINQNYQTFNPPSVVIGAPVCGDNCISGYNASLPPAFQQDTRVFFGKNPVTLEYGDLRLRVKNIGTYAAVVGGTTLSVGDSIVLDIDTFNYKIKLPANNALLSGGTFYNGAPLLEDSLTECIYDFTFEVDYEEFNFQLRNSDNSVSTTKEFYLGSFVFNDTFLSLDADNSANYYNLVTQYSNVWPYWESNFVFPATGPYCLTMGTLFSPDPDYPTASGDLQDVFVDGIMFLHQDSANQASPSLTKTQYLGFNFLSNNQKAQDSGCISVNIQNPFTAFGPQLLTVSIPFDVI